MQHVTQRAAHGGTVSNLYRLAAPTTWRVVERAGQLVHIHGISGASLASFDAETQASTMLGMAQWELLAYRLELTSERLLSRAQVLGPSARKRDAEIAEANFAALMMARSTPSEVRRLAATDRQLELDMGEAA